MEGIDLIIPNTAATGDVVFDDRIDRFTFKGKKLDLQDGKIVLHRDYFNYPTWKNATGISLDMEIGS